MKKKVLRSASKNRPAKSLATPSQIIDNSFYKDLLYDEFLFEGEFHIQFDLLFNSLVEKLDIKEPERAQIEIQLRDSFAIIYFDWIIDYIQQLGLIKKETVNQNKDSVTNEVLNRIIPAALNPLNIFIALLDKTKLKEALDKSNSLNDLRSGNHYNNNEKYTKFYPRAQEVFLSNGFSDSNKAALKQAIKELGTPEEIDNYINDQDKLRLIQSAFSGWLKSKLKNKKKAK